MQIKLLILPGKLKTQLVQSMLPLQYAQHVLVPKIAARLIQQDMQLKDFGVAMQPMQKARKLGNFPNSSCRSKDKSTIVFFLFY
ncbi:hypothetical protein VTP01DRAFT_4685 [Rhizomucor pusillus]|uniref:uncharacterized protein n=1 Tax=Rhizomucor pusillus TaxID=4840 RepID=UPI00374367C5